MSGSDSISPLPSVALLNNERVMDPEMKVFGEKGVELFGNVDAARAHSHREEDPQASSSSSKELVSNEILGGGGDEERTVSGVSEVSDFSPSILPPQLTPSQPLMQPSTSSAPPPPYPCNLPPEYPQSSTSQFFCPSTPKPLRMTTCTFLRLVFY